MKPKPVVSSYLSCKALLIDVVFKVLGAVLALDAGIAQAANLYAVTDLGTLGGNFSYGYGINVSGQVVGTSGTVPGSDAANHAFVWTPGVGMMDLATLGGTYSVGQGINDSGQVVGWSTIPGNADRHAFVWTPGVGMRDLGTVGGVTSSSSEAWGINDKRLVVGQSATAGHDSVEHAFVWTSSIGMTDLGTLGGPSSAAHAINGDGQVVGVSATAANVPNLPHAFLWTSGVGMTDLGTLGGLWSNAYGITQGSVAWATISPPDHCASGS